MPSKKTKGGKTKQKTTGGGKPVKQYEFPDNFHNLPNTRQFFRPKPQVLVDDQIVVVDKCFSAELCNELIKSFETSKELLLETTIPIRSKEYAMRVNDRAITIDYDASQVLWKYLKQILVQDLGYQDDDMDASSRIFADAIGLNPQLRIYRYGKGQYFSQHYDDSVMCEMNNGGKGERGRTQWTLLVYLTGGDEFIGGGTIFFPETGDKKPLNIHPSKGLALLHKHGDDCMLHEGEVVISGEKWVLRSDIVYLN